MNYPVIKGKVRVFTWIILAINILMLAWVITGIVSASGPGKNCGSLTKSECDAANHIGGGIGVGLLIGLWVAVDVILGIIWLVTRRREPQVIYVQSPGSAQAAPSPARFSEPVHTTDHPMPRARSRATVPAPMRHSGVALGRQSTVETFRGRGSGSFSAQIDASTQVTFTCGGTWGRTVLQVDGTVLADVVGAHMIQKTVERSGGPARFDVQTDGTWSVFLERIR